MKIKDYSEYYKAINFIESLNNLRPNKTTANGKDLAERHNRMNAFLSRVDDPHKKLKFVHITGTSGKGSTATMCHAILKTNGYRTGLYRSPHITSFIERIKVDELFIAPDSVIEMTKRFKKELEYNLTHKPYDILSFGELAFCMALTYFVEQECTHAVIEVGCGGLNDSTNIIPPPECAIITNIGHDHLKSLGPTLANVTREKSHIIKKNSLCLTTETKPRYQKIIQARCLEVGATYTQLDTTKILSETNADKKSISFIFENHQYTLPTLGEHQCHNAIIAISMAKYFKIQVKVIEQALKSISLPARVEIMQKKPLVILDGAHNLEKINSTTKTLLEIKQDNPNSKITAILSLIHGKDATKILNKLLPILDKIILTRHTHTFRKVSHPYKLISTIKKLRTDIEITVNLDALDAIREIMKNSSKNDIILITGSLYMAGYARRYWVPENTILEKRTL